jgi:23S rRNA (cytidine2498-2'-O)-methyltransferase
MAKIFCTCTPDNERFLARELERCGLTSIDSGSGSVSASCPGEFFLPFFSKSALCFAQIALDSPAFYLSGNSSALVRDCCDYFCSSIRQERVDAPWPLVIEAIGEKVVSQEQRTAIAKELLARLKKAVSRVANLAQQPQTLTSGLHRGLCILLADRNFYVCREWWSGGQRRMKLAPGAPSRSYLKVEEAYAILGRSPRQGETVVDLGAAPGGWSFSAAERGARVIAVDNGLLKEGALENPLIRHVQEDAFTYEPSVSPVDWLFCDMVEDPQRIIALVRTWLKRKWCRYLIVNLKFGRTDPLALLDRLNDKEQGIASFCTTLATRHLYHDREELTVMGEARGN